MSYALDYAPTAARATESARAAFIRRTYTHLAGAVLAFAGIEIAIFNLVPADVLSRTVFANPATMLIILVAFIGVGYLARMWAYGGTSQAMQYMGLALYVVFEALIFVPILTIAVHYTDNRTILPKAAIMTLAMFGGLTVAALVTRKDFSFLRSILSIGCFLMIGLTVAAIFFRGFDLGLWYSFLGVALASGFILYDTSNVLHHFNTNQHVAAALELFSSLAYLFFHVLRILLILNRSR